VAFDPGYRYAAMCGCSGGRSPARRAVQGHLQHHLADAGMAGARHL